MTFAGIPIAALDFYDDLELNNSREFWTAHKHVYDEQVVAPLKELAAALEPEFGKPKIFRPHRDVRFSKDKTPYKTNQGVVFMESAVYLHVGAGGLFMAGGQWQMSSEQVGRLRHAVANDITGLKLEAILKKLTTQGWEIGGEELKRVPAGFDKEHPRANLLRHKALTAHREFGVPDWLSTPEALGEIRNRFRQFGPLNEWLNTHAPA